MKWRRARAEDAEAIGRLSVDILGELGEPPAIFAERIALCPEGCHVLASGADILGHMISHPWVRGRPPALNQMLRHIPAGADCWYIHEVALREAARGQGCIRAILRQLADTAVAAGLPVMALVAVANAVAYWQRLGFRPAPLAADGIDSYTGSYGGAAAYLEMEL